MDSSTHKVLCCVGSAVGGQPTQFVMEKAIAAAHLDWRVITVEVEPDNLEAAIAGMRAMRFTAIRFFPPLESRAAQLMSGQCAVTSFVGGITSARNNNGTWECWHNSGLALIDCFANRGDWAAATVWLDGDGETIRSLVAANIQLSARRILWSNPPSDLPSEISSRTISCRFSVQDAEATDRIVAEIGTESETACLVLMGSQVSERVHALATLETLSSRQLVVFSSTSSDKGRSQIDWPGKLAIIDQPALEIAKEIVDCRRWTDRQPVRSEIQDAYEEYMDL